MDGDPVVEPELDTFSLILPLPYRIAVILVLGTRTIFCLTSVLQLMLDRRLGLGCQSTLPFHHQDRKRWLAKDEAQNTDQKA